MNPAETFSSSILIKEHLCRTMFNTCSPEYKMTKGQVTGAKTVILCKEFHSWQCNIVFDVSHLCTKPLVPRGHPVNAPWMKTANPRRASAHYVTPGQIPATFSKETSILKTISHITHKINGPCIESLVLCCCFFFKWSTSGSPNIQ